MHPVQHTLHAVRKFQLRGLPTAIASDFLGLRPDTVNNKSRAAGHRVAVAPIEVREFWFPKVTPGFLGATGPPVIYNFLFDSENFLNKTNYEENLNKRGIIKSHGT